MDSAVPARAISSSFTSFVFALKYSAERPAHCCSCSSTCFPVSPRGRSELAGQTPLQAFEACCRSEEPERDRPAPRFAPWPAAWSHRTPESPRAIRSGSGPPSVADLDPCPDTSSGKSLSSPVKPSKMSTNESNETLNRKGREGKPQRTQRTAKSCPKLNADRQIVRMHNSAVRDIGTSLQNLYTVERRVGYSSPAGGVPLCATLSFSTA